MQHLPPEILHKILEYDGKIVYRSGKYIDRISKDDSRYKMLRRIPKPIFVCMDRNIPLVILRNKNYGDTHYILIKKSIHKENYNNEGILLNRNTNTQNQQQHHDAILFMMEKYASSYDKMYELRRIFT